MVELTSSTSTTSSEGVTGSSSEQNVHETIIEPMPEPSTSRGRKSFITERLVSVFDKCKISDRDAVHILTAAAEAFEVDVDPLVINRTSIWRARRNIRERKAEKLRAEFNDVNLNATVLHWDGKLLPALTSREMEDRLPILITDGDYEKLLHVSQLEHGTGKCQADAIFEILCEYGLKDQVKAMCFDTTATNTGVKQGTCLRLEQLLERSLLYFACRHHVFEILMRGVFEKKIPGTVGPDVPFFKEFRNQWSKIDKTKFRAGIEEREICKLFKDDKERILQFLREKLDSPHARADYKEFLELCIIFLGESPKDEISFRQPGAIHHARWMAKVVYSLKIFIFRKVFKLKPATEKALAKITVFIVKIYVRVWFSAPIPITAPNLDFGLLKDLYDYKSIDPEISDAGLQKLLNHLWYLNEENMGLAFFDDTIPEETKEKMRLAIENTPFDDEDEGPEKRVRIKIRELKKIFKNGLEQFVTTRTKYFFRIFGISLNFLSKPSSEWMYDEEFVRGKEIVSKLKVVNDAAERGVRLISEYLGMTKDEDQQQFILHIVKDYKQQFPDAKKSTLMLKDINT
jgi:hypothetical protein